MITPRVWLAALFLFLCNAGLHWPIALSGVTPYRGSIERGYAYMGQLFANNPDYLSWNPLQYCGIPMHYVYLPLLPYLDALILWLQPGTDAAYVHRAVCAAAVFAAPAVLFLMVRQLSGRGWAGFYSALAFTFFSPLYVFIKTIDDDRGFMQVPWRIQVLIKYGEGPHTFGICVLMIALIAVWRVAFRPGFGPLLLAALMLAATVLTNWVAGLALAFCVLMLMLAQNDNPDFHWRRIIHAGLLGYTFAAFWLTPSFVLRMAFNWPKDAFGFQFENLERFALLGWLITLLLIRLAFRRFPQHRFLCWLCLCTFGFGFLVMVFYRYGINPIPEARRYALEFELFLLLLLCELFRMGIWHRRFWVQAATVFTLLVILLQQTPQVTRFFGHHYKQWELLPRESTSEYRVAKALADLHPTGRVYITGGTRFRFNSWFPIPQTEGVFETGLLTRVALDLGYQIRTDLGFENGREAERSLLLLRAMAVEYVVVHGDGSEEYYHDIKNPAKFDGTLEKVWSEKGDTIYRVAPVHFAHLLKTTELPFNIVKYGYFPPWVPYVNAMLDTERPQLQFQWQDARTARITGAMPIGMLVAFSMPWDPNWHAYQNGHPVKLQALRTGFMATVPLAEASQGIELKFEPSWEERLCALLSIATIGGSFFLLWRKRTA